MASTNRKIDQHSTEGKALQATVQKKLRDYLGENYSDEVLPLYIVVMISHGTSETVVAENLDAFLGKDAPAFTSWLFQHMGELMKVDALKITEGAIRPAELADAQAAPQQAAGDADQVSLSHSSDSMSDSTHEDDASEEQAPPANAASEPRSHERQQQTRRHSDGRVDERTRGSGDHRDLRGRDHYHERTSDERHPDPRGRRDSYSRRDRYAQDHHLHDRGRGGWRSGWEPGWQPDHFGGPRGYWVPAYPPPYARGYGSYEHQRYRSMSPPRYHRGRSPDRYERGSEREPRRRDEWFERYDGGDTDMRDAGSRQRLSQKVTREGSMVPPEIDFEAKAQDVPPQYRRRVPSQLAQPSQQQQQQQPVEPDIQAEQPAAVNGGLGLRTESAPVAVAHHPGALAAPAGVTSAAPSAFERLSGMQSATRRAATQFRAQAPEFSQSLPANFVQQTGTAGHTAKQVPLSAWLGNKQQQQGNSSVFDRLAPSSVFQRLDANAAANGAQQGSVFNRLGGANPPAGGVDAATIQSQLAHMSDMLSQLRAAAQLERVKHAPPPITAAAGPVDARSITVTNVHPLALEHPAILRAHFGICGRIVRATVLRDRRTGMPTGKAHIEYTEMLAAQKAVRLSHSLLLDRTVRVRLKSGRRY